MFYMNVLFFRILSLLSLNKGPAFPKTFMVSIYFRSTWSGARIKICLTLLFLIELYIFHEKIQSYSLDIRPILITDLKNSQSLLCQKMGMCRRLILDG